MGLLDKGGNISEASWNLIQMIATSPEIYTRVLRIQSARENGNIDWKKFFDSHSVYKLLYTLQIVEAVMEEGEGEGLERVDVIDDTDIKKNKGPIPPAPPLPGAAVLPPGAVPTLIHIEATPDDSTTVPTSAENSAASNKEE